MNFVVTPSLAAIFVLQTAHEPSADNLAIDDRNRFYVSDTADNCIQETDPETSTCTAKLLIVG